MNQAARTINTDLNADADLQAVVQGKQYWEFAPDNTKTPLITYSIRENKRPTKDKGGNYDVKVRCFGKTLVEASTVSELVYKALIATNYRYRGGESGYTEIEPFEGFVELNFNFNL